MSTIVFSSEEIDSLPLNFKRSIQSKYSRGPILGQMRLCSMGVTMQAKEVPGTIREKKVTIRFMRKIVKLPTTTVLKGSFTYVFHMCG